MIGVKCRAEIAGLFRIYIEQAVGERSVRAEA